MGNKEGTKRDTLKETKETGEGGDERDEALPDLPLPASCSVPVRRRQALGFRV